MIYSGKNGWVRIGGARANATRWVLERTRSGRSYTANDTGRWPRRLGGARTSAGRLELKLDDAGHAPLHEGDEVLFTAAGENVGRLWQ